jgi:hypothetical protein
MQSRNFQNNYLDILMIVYVNLYINISMHNLSIEIKLKKALKNGNFF